MPGPADDLVPLGLRVGVVYEPVLECFKGQGP